MTTLGQQLAQNIEREKQAAYDSAAALEQMRTAEARAKFLTVQEFFEDAKSYFTAGIMGKLPSNSLYRQVGGARYSSPSEDCHVELDKVIDAYQQNSGKGGTGPASMYDPKRFASLWTEFQQWATSQGLKAAWHYCWSSGGEDSWWQLRVDVPGITHR
jgi:hypothetical protein